MHKRTYETYLKIKKYIDFRLDKNNINFLKHPGFWRGPKWDEYLKRKMEAKNMGKSFYNLIKNHVTIYTPYGITNVFNINTLLPCNYPLNRAIELIDKKFSKRVMLEEIEKL